MRNQETRIEIKESGIRYWMIAEKLGISDVTFSRRLRKELPTVEKLKIRQVISEIKEASKHATVV